MKPDELTDDELVAAVTQEIMGWDGPTVESDSGELHGNRSRYRPGDVCKDWRPLESWDDCMMVVDSMRAKGWRFGIDDTSQAINTVLVYFDKACNRTLVHRMREGMIDHLVSQRKAIFRAAIAAITAEKEQPHA